MRHLIKKQIIELRLDKRLNYYQVQQKISDRYWNEMLPLLEKEFNAVSGENKLVEIDKFELELGEVSAEKIGANDWMEEIRKKIEEKLAALTNPGSSQYGVRILERREGIISQWFFYMDHGFLTWNTEQIDEKWHYNVLEALATDVKWFQLLKEKISRDSYFLKRIVIQHEDLFLKKLTEIITASKHDSILDFIDELVILNRHTQKRKKVLNESDNELRGRLWQNVLRWASTDIQHPQRLCSELVRFFVQDKMVTEKIPPVTAGKLEHIMPLIKQYSEKLKSKLKEEIQKTEKIVGALNTRINDIKCSHKGLEPTEYNLNVPDEEGIFIPNAGAVLLHPFLKTFFSRLELIKGNDFINEHAKGTCLYLINYLVTGKCKAGEFELTIAKILCAFPLDLPVEPAEDFSAKYIHEADELLEAAIAQWKILKNTSKSGLREGFLQRPGLLFKKNGDYYLRVEKSSIDVLLDYLPWNLSIIMLPWMKNILRVEWR
jgi:hypothetical protein